MSYGKKILTDLLNEIDSMTIEDYNKLYEETQKILKTEPYGETKVHINTQISICPFLKVESKGVYIFPTNQMPQREKVASNNFVFSETTLAKPVFLTS